MKSHWAKLGDITSLVSATGQNQMILVDGGILGWFSFINNCVLTILILKDLFCHRCKIEDCFEHSDMTADAVGCVGMMVVWWISCWAAAQPCACHGGTALAQSGSGKTRWQRGLGAQAMLPGHLRTRLGWSGATFCGPWWRLASWGRVVGRSGWSGILGRPTPTSSR